MSLNRPADRQELERRLERLDSPAVADAQRGQNVLDPRIRLLVPGPAIAGPAFTARACPGSFLTVQRALLEASPGDVLVIDGGADLAAGALWGDIVAAEAKRRGFKAIVIDGPARDLRGLLGVGFPTFATGLTPRLGTNPQVGPLGVPVSCGGVPVRPGDWIFGDGDGVVVLPVERVGAILEAAEALERRDREMAARVADGESLADLLGLRPLLYAEQQTISVMLRPPGTSEASPERESVNDAAVRRVGFIGLGNIGRPMARRLLDAGYALTVHNRSRGVVDELARLGATPVGAPREVVEASDVVLTALPFPVTVEEIYFGPDGLCAHARPGQVVIDHSTVGPETSLRAAEALLARGAAFLDAPVSGGPEAAAAGALAIMVGGDPEAFEQVRPILETLGGHVRLCGPTGAGSTMKLLNQVLITVHSAATAEVLRLAEQAGVDPQMALETISAGLAASAILDRNGRRIVDGDFAPGARIDLMVKDAALVRQLCDDLGLRLPVFSQARAGFEQALNLGFGHEDLAGVIRTLRPAPARAADAPADVESRDTTSPPVGGGSGPFERGG